MLLHKGFICYFTINCIFLQTDGPTIRAFVNYMDCEEINCDDCKRLRGKEL